MLTLYRKYTWLLVLSLGLCMTACDDDEATPPEAIADFSFAPASPGATNIIAGEVVQFTDLSTNTSDYNWSFGDGNTATAKNPTHVYSMAGTYSVTLLAVGEGGNNRITKQLTVLPTPPVAAFSIDNEQPIQVGDPIIITNETENGETYFWDFGDGTTSTEETPTHAYSAAGEYVIFLRASSASGESTTNQEIVIVEPDLGLAEVFWVDSDENVLYGDGDALADLTAIVSETIYMSYSPETGLLYIVDSGNEENNGKIISITPSGTEETVIVDNLIAPMGIEVEGTSMYWVEAAGRIMKANLDGSAVEEVLDASTVVGGGTDLFAITLSSNKIYWSDKENPGVYTANLDGSEASILIPDVVVDGLEVYQDFLYYNDNRSPFLFLRSDLLGQNVLQLQEDVGGITGIVVDPDTETLYWGDRFLSTVNEANLDGTNATALYDGLTRPQGVAILKPALRGTTPGGTPPVVASFTVENEGSLEIDLPVQFTNTSQNAVSFAWDFGDGAGTSTEESPQYTYTAAGQYTVTLTATGEDSSTDEATATITVTDPTVAGPGVFWVDSSDNAFYKDGQLVADLSDTIIFPIYMSYDPTGDHFYIADAGDPETPNGKIVRISPDGTGETDVLTGLTEPFGIEIVSNEMYIAEIGGLIKRSNLDGSAETTLINANDLVGGVAELYAVTVSANKLYWSDQGDAPGIYMANLDGTEAELLVADVFAHGLEVHGDFLYFNDDTDPFFFYRTDLEGNNLEELSREVGRIYGIVVDPDTETLYWTDRDLGNVTGSNLDGSSAAEVYTSLSSPRGIGIQKTPVRGTTPDGAAPVMASFAVENEGSLEINVAVQFTNTSQNAVSFAWDFGDGAGTSIEENPQYTYTAAGQYTVTLTATGEDSSTDEATATITVAEPASGLTSFLYYIDNVEGKIFKTDPEVGDKAEILSLGGADLGVGLAYSDGKLYYTDGVVSTGAIYRADADGSNIETLITGVDEPSDIEVHNGRIYYGTFDQIRSANLDGTDDQAVLTTSGGPASLEIYNGRIYWADLVGSVGGIFSSNLDGTDVQEIISGATIGRSFGIAIDPTNEKMYFHAQNSDEVLSANLDGSAQAMVLSDLAGFQARIALDLENAKLYISDSGVGAFIKRTDFDGANVEDVVLPEYAREMVIVQE